MRSRITTIWLSLMTLYMAYTTTDTYSVLKIVQGNQESTLRYMERSASILKRLKVLKLIEAERKDKSKAGFDAVTLSRG